MKLKLPTNGSFSGNLSLLVAGSLLGAGATWSFRPGGLFGEPFVTASVVPEARPSASRNALAGNAGGPRDSARATQARNNPAASAFAISQDFRDAGALAAAEDLAAALEASGGIASAADQLDYLRGIYAVWAETDPAGALEHAKANFQPGLLQSELMGLALNKWGQDHPREAWLWADANLEGPLKERGLSDLLIGWTRRSPNDAANWLANSGLTSSSLFSALSRTWAESDPTAALDWAGQLPDGKAKDRAEIIIADTLAGDKPEKAVETFQEQLAKADKPDLVVTIANRWASLDPVAAAQWLSSLPDGFTRREAVATLATVWAASDVKGALAWSAGLTDTSLRTRINTYIATTWGAIEPEKALTWLAEQPAAEVAEGVRGAFHSWAATDPVGLESYLQQAANTAWGEQARRSLADVRSQNDPAGALELALGLSETGIRDDSMANYFRKWSQRDNVSADDWLNMNSKRLPDSTLTRLTDYQGKGGQEKPQIPSTGLPEGF